MYGGIVGDDTYSVFISYGGPDGQFAESLGDELVRNGIETS